MRGAVVVRHGRRVLDGLDLDVPTGVVTGLAGDNGSGKTTAMRVVLGLLRPAAGSTSWYGPAAAPRPGYLPEQRGLYPRVPALRQLAYLARLAGDDRRAAAAAAADALNEVGVDDASRRTPAERLSLGNAQRVQLAAALLGPPDLLVLDEPFNGLDRGGVATVVEVLSRAADRGAAVLVSTHDQHLMDRVADRLVVLRDGRAR